MYELLKPRVVLPVHGDKRQIREHKRFALSSGIDEVFSAQNGDICLYNNGKIEKIEEFTAEIMGVDRRRNVPLTSELIKNRRRIMYNCSVFISAVISKDYELQSIEITSIDILEENEWYILKEEILKEVTPLIVKKLKEEPHKNSITDFIRGQIRKRILNRTDIKPVTFLHVHWEDDEKINIQGEEND
jgi:ribonuclease J